MFNCRFYRLYKFFIHSTIEFIICEICEANKALLCTGHPPARVRQISGFVKLSVYVFYKVLSAKACLYPFKKVS